MRILAVVANDMQHSPPIGNTYQPTYQYKLHVYIYIYIYLHPSRGSKLPLTTKTGSLLTGDVKHIWMVIYRCFQDQTWRILQVQYPFSTWSWDYLLRHVYIFNMYSIFNIYIYIYIWFFIFRASLGGWYPTFPNTVCSDIWHVQFLFGGPRLPPPWLRHDMDSFLGGWGQRQTHVSGYFREGTHHWVIYSQYHKNKKHTHTTCIYLKTCIYINIYLWKYTFYPCALEKNIHTLHLQTSPNQLRCRQVSCSRGQSGFFQGCLLRFAQPRAAPRDNFAGFGVDLHRAPPGPRGQSL